MRLIVALDAGTGKEQWRFNTIPRPGTPGGNSWNGLAQEDRNGGSVWIPGSYDPVNNLVLRLSGGCHAHPFLKKYWIPERNHLWFVPRILWHRSAF